MKSHGPRPQLWLIRFRCGHRQRRNLGTVPTGQRVTHALLIARGLCPTCRRIVDHAQHQTRRT
jgi:hypothetical protein